MRLIIADDHEMIVEGLSQKLRNTFSDVEVTTVGGFQELRAICDAEGSFDLAVVDLGMPDGDWASELRYLRAEHPSLRILVLSGLESGDIVRQVLPQLADGFVPKSAPARLLVRAIEIVLDGGTYVPTTALQASIEQPDRSPITDRSDQRLTSRQLEVLELIARGKPNKLIAHELGLSIGTVKIHVSNILTALGATNRTEALARARSLNLSC